MNENEFFYMDSTKIPPVELMDEFFKEVYADEKAIDWEGIGYGALSGLIGAMAGTELGITNQVLQWVWGGGFGGLNVLIEQLLRNIGVQNPNPNNIDWDQFYNEFYNYMLEYGFNPSAIDATSVWFEWPWG